MKWTFERLKRELGKLLIVPKKGWREAQKEIFKQSGWTYQEFRAEFNKLRPL